MTCARKRSMNDVPVLRIWPRAADADADVARRARTTPRRTRRTLLRMSAPTSARLSWREIAAAASALSGAVKGRSAESARRRRAAMSVVEGDEEEVRMGRRTFARH
jgi:hypothetical protein